MRPDTLAKLWWEYQLREIDRSIHPADHMFNTAKNGWDDYHLVGVSGARVIHSVLGSAPMEAATRVLDFGCGHGRVARHLRAMFPGAQLYFADIDPTGTEFCAEVFKGTGITTTADLSKIELPENMSLIWVGSVFTHLDYGRMVTLFDKLFGALAPGGALIATFRGEHMYQQMKAEPHPGVQAKWKNLLDQYESGGVGYLTYGVPELGDWGLSLTTIDRVAGLGRRHANARLIGYTEAGWAAVHDVASWTKK